MRAASQHDDALLLRSLDYGEADRIVTLLTRGHGKLSLLARGARKSRRRFAGALEPFALLDAELSLGRSELGNLHAAQVARAFPAILRDLSRMTAAGTAFSLLRDLLPERAPEEGIFEAALGLLEDLDAALCEPRAVLLAFQAHVLGLSGFAPRLSLCGVCGKHPAAGQSADFDPARGYLVCQHCGGAAYRLRASTRDLLEQALEGKFRQVATAAWDDAQLAEAEAALGVFIQHRIDRPVGKSVRVARPRSPGPSDKR